MRCHAGRARLPIPVCRARGAAAPTTRSTRPRSSCACLRHAHPDLTAQSAAHHRALSGDVRWSIAGQKNDRSGWPAATPVFCRQPRRLAAVQPLRSFCWPAMDQRTSPESPRWCAALCAVRSGCAWRRQAQLDLGRVDLVVGAAARRARQMYGEARAACMAAHACAASTHSNRSH